MTRLSWLRTVSPQRDGREARVLGLIAVGLAVVALIGCSSTRVTYTDLPVASRNDSNPIISNKFTADPAPMVLDWRLYLYVGHDEAGEGEIFRIAEWLLYSTEDIVTRRDHGPVLRPEDFSWTSRDAWASEVIEKDERFWFYTTVEHDETDHEKANRGAGADKPG